MLMQAYESGQVRRYHTNPVIGRFGQTNADHQWGCAILIDQLHPNPTLALYQAALRHDAGELKAGDLPHHFKVGNPEVAEDHAEIEHAAARSIGMGQPELTDNEAYWLKFVDRLERIFYVKIYAPELLEAEAWREQINEILAAAIDLEVGMQVYHLIKEIE